MEIKIESFMGFSLSKVSGNFGSLRKIACLQTMTNAEVKNSSKDMVLFIDLESYNALNAFVVH